MHASPVWHPGCVGSESRLTYRSYPMSLLNIWVPLAFHWQHFFWKLLSLLVCQSSKMLEGIFRCLKFVFLSLSSMWGIMLRAPLWV